MQAGDLRAVFERFWHAPVIDDDGFDLHSRRAVNHADGSRVEELDHLKLALATFALQLDAFEMRARELLLVVGPSDNSALLPGSGGLSLED